MEETGLTKEDKLLKWLEKTEDAGMQRTKQWVGTWQNSLRYFFSDQLHGRKEHEDWDWVIVNYIWPSAIQETAKLSRNHARMIVNPQDPTDADYAEAWQAGLQWLWEKGINTRGMRLEQIYAIFISKIFGYCISKVYWEDKTQWDTQSNQWIGDVRHKLWHPAEFWASDSECIDSGDCGTVRYVELEYAVHRWPKYKTKFEEKAKSFREGMGTGDVVRGQNSLAGTYPSTGYGGKDKGADTIPNLVNLILQTDKTAGTQSAFEMDKKFVRISETYFRDYEEETLIERTEIPPEELIKNGLAVEKDGYYMGMDGEQITEWPSNETKRKIPKYPFGRYILWCEDFIINDQPYPYKKWPFIVKPHYLLPFMWQGVDAVQLYKTAQDGINITLSHLFNNLKQFGDPRIAIEDDAISAPPKGKKKYKIFSGAGSIIRLKRGGINKYRVEHPIPPSASAVTLYNLFAQEYKNISGMQDISLGKKTSGEMSATEASVLAISSNDRIHLQSVFEDEWIKQVATLVAEICQDKYDVGRLIKIIGEDHMPGTQLISQKMKDVRIDIDIEPGQTLPFDEDRRIGKYEKAYAILQQPIPNPMTPEMLRVLEIPNWQKLLTRYEAWQQYVQFLQLYEGVKNGQIDPNQAVQVITQKAMEIYSQQQQAPQEGGQNAGSV